MKTTTAGNILLTILGPVIVFHLLVLFQVIPYTIVWGGRLKSVEEMYLFELVSIFLNLLLLFITLQKTGYIRQVVSEKAISIIFYLFLVLFLLNTIGNLTAKSSIELIGGTLFTSLSAFLCWILAKRK